MTTLATGTVSQARKVGDEIRFIAQPANSKQLIRIGSGPKPRKGTVVSVSGKFSSEGNIADVVINLQYFTAVMSDRT